MEREAVKSRKRPRRWSVAEKEALIAKSDEPDATVLAVARQHGIHPNLLSAWRAQRQHGLLGAAQGESGVVAVRVSEAPEAVVRAGLIEIVLASGWLIRVDRDVDSVALGRVLDVVGR